MNEIENQPDPIINLTDITAIGSIKMIFCEPYNAKILPSACEKRLILLTKSNAKLLFADNAKHCLTCSRGQKIIRDKKLKIKEPSAHACNVCGGTKEHGAEFHFTPSNKFNLAYTCKKCSNERARKWNQETRDRKIAKMAMGG